MSIPSASCDVQTGVMAASAAFVSRQLRPAMLPLSSMRKMVSNWRRKAYGESEEVDWEVVVSRGVYAGGASMGAEFDCVFADGLFKNGFFEGERLEVLLLRLLLLLLLG